MENPIEKKVKDFTRNYYRWYLEDKDDENNNNLERYVDYRDEFPQSDIEKILSSDNPRDTLFDTITDWDCNCDDWYYETEFWKELATFCEENHIIEDEARDYIYETFYWTYPESFLNPTFRAVVIINHGDMNYDFTLHNILNYASDGDELEEKAGLYWLAKQQKKLTLLKKAIKNPDKKTGDRFVDSCITELEECSSHMNALTFLVEMDLNTAINIMEKQKSALKDKVYNEYNPQETKGAPLGYITFDSSVTCGLFDTWNGSGSMLDIQCEKDIKLPLHFIDRIDTDSRIQSVYGLTSECWGSSVKETKIIAEKVKEVKVA